MKTIELKKDVEVDKKKFEFLYTGFIIGGTLIQQKGMLILRREIKILDKLCSISQDCECGKKIIQDEPLRELTGGVIEFDDQEYQLLHSYVTSVPWSTGKAVREAVATIDWLESL